MNEPKPHYVLMAQTSRTESFGTDTGMGPGHWRFVLRPTDGSNTNTKTIEVADVEPDIRGERLDLLTVIRALESLDQPSRVTLIGCSRYVRRGIQYGLAEWRDNQWRWELFGQMVPVRDADLWQRMDRLLQFHQVECGQRRFDAQHASLTGHHEDGSQTAGNWADRIAEGDWIKHYAPVLVNRCVACIETVFWFWQKMTVASGFGGQCPPYKNL